MNFSDYEAIDAVNWSTLSEMRNSPKHYKHRLSTPKPDTVALRRGRIGHVALFEPERFEDTYIVEPDFGDCRKTDRTSKEEAKGNKTRRDAWRKQNTGRILVTAAEYAQATAVRDAVRAHPEAMKYLQAGIAEQSVTWTDAATGLPCKARLDWVSRSEPAVVDLKLCRDISMVALERAMMRYGYNSQLAHYTAGWCASYDADLPGVIIAAEGSAPHDVGVFRLDEEALDYGRDEVAELLKRVAVHRGLNMWPGRYPIEMTLRLPAWATQDDDEDLSETDIEWSKAANG